MKKILSRCVVVAMMLIGSSAVAGTASAAPGDCWNGKLCFWTGDNYNGSLFMYPVYSSGQCHNLSSLNNDAETLWNRTNSGVRVYKGANCTGDNRYMRPNQQAQLGVSFDNTISSFKYR